MQPPRSRIPWALAVTVGLCSGLAGYVIHAAMTRRAPKQVVTVHKVTEMAGSEESPAISPDGTKIAFVAMSDGKRQIWVRQVSGGSPTPITRDDADHSAPRWAPDSRSLIYYTPGTIWEIPLSGGEARRVVTAAAPGDLSHDGKSLAFFRLQDRSIELAVTTRDALSPRTIAKWSFGIYSNVRWAPDDKGVAFLQDYNFQTKVIVIRFSGGEAIEAAGRELRIQGFTWTPDNAGLIVSSREEGPSFNLWFIPRLEGLSRSQLTFGELSYESPDVDAAGDVVVSRRGLAGQDADIVMFSGLRW